MLKHCASQYARAIQSCPNADLSLFHAEWCYYSMPVLYFWLIEHQWAILQELTPQLQPRLVVGGFLTQHLSDFGPPDGLIKMERSTFALGCFLTGCRRSRLHMLTPLTRCLVWCTLNVCLDNPEQTIQQRSSTRGPGQIRPPSASSVSADVYRTFLSVVCSHSE